MCPFSARDCNTVGILGNFRFLKLRFITFVTVLRRNGSATIQKEYVPKGAKKRKKWYLLGNIIEI